jgi:hypothetical protein
MRGATNVAIAKPMRRPTQLRIVVMGMIGRCPFGGQTWLSLNWVRGFQRLGHEIWYVEDDTVWPYDPVRNTVTSDCAYAVRHIATSMERIGLSNYWAFRFRTHKGNCWGLTEQQLNDLYCSCDLLINFGATDLCDEQMAAPVRVYVESDPVTSELRLANGDEHTQVAFSNHNAFFTYGENYGAPDCRVPLNGMHFNKTRQPVDLEFWPFSFDSDAKYFTTIGNYRQKGNDVKFNGEVYRWSKHYEWEKFMHLPTRTVQPFELAMFPDDAADRDRLRNSGWRLSHPFEMSLDVFGAYRSYIRQSRGEFTVAKDQNVRLRSGWFSERDACYLACGKPVVAQDTGFSSILPTGQGLFGVLTVDEAVAAIDEINSDYRKHCKAARAIAEQYFEASKVADHLLAALHLGACRG